MSNYYPAAGRLRPPRQRARILPPQAKPGIKARDQFIQGHRVGSLAELYLASALYQLDVPFQYQVTISYGRRARTGQVLDFLCYIPYEQPVQVYGEYWHSGRRKLEDEIGERILFRLYRREVVVFYDYELESVDAAVAIARDRLRV